MGAKQTTIGQEKRGKEQEPASAGDEVNFNHFQALRSIGRGSFGKVCIVQKKDSKKLYAMKYASKLKCIHDGAVGNMLQEQQLLRNLEHPFIVNLRYAFQDVEDLFMVEDLLLGGDLRYHLQQMGKMAERDVLLYVAELALALDYLRSRSILHRDIKPDNILLDEEGRAHLTDFNVATVLDDGRLATSQCGTQPYIAPEVFACAVGERTGYSFPADWWSLGVTACELLKGKRPFEVPSSPTQAWEMFRMGEIHFSSNMSDDIKAVLSRLISVDPEARLCSAAGLVAQVPNLDLDAVLHKKLRHTFVPSTKQLNVDPTYELEELIIESKPIHKKKQRLAKVATDAGHTVPEQDEHVLEQLQQLEERFLPYNWESALKACVPGPAAESLTMQSVSDGSTDDHSYASQPAARCSTASADSPALRRQLQSNSRCSSPANVRPRNAGGSSSSSCSTSDRQTAAAAAAAAQAAGSGTTTPRARKSSGASGELPASASRRRSSAAGGGGGSGSQRPAAVVDEDGCKQAAAAAEVRRSSAVVQELCTSAIICSAAMIADYTPAAAKAEEGVLRAPGGADDEVGVADAITVASSDWPPVAERRASAAPCDMVAAEAPEAASTEAPAPSEAAAPETKVAEAAATSHRVAGDDIVGAYFAVAAADLTVDLRSCWTVVACAMADPPHFAASTVVLPLSECSADDCCRTLPSPAVAAAAAAVHCDGHSSNSSSTFSSGGATSSDKLEERSRGDPAACCCRDELGPADAVPAAATRPSSDADLNVAQDGALVSTLSMRIVAADAFSRIDAASSIGCAANRPPDEPSRTEPPSCRRLSADAAVEPSASG